MHARTWSLLLAALLLLLPCAAPADEPCNGRKSSLPAPASLNAWSVPDDVATPLADETAVAARWDAVPGATKYSVEVVAAYQGCTRSQTFQFTVLAPATSISIPLAELGACADVGCGEVLQAEAVALHVKALNPPRGRDREAQCNPYTPALTVDVRGDGVDGDCDGEVDEGLGLAP